MNEHQPQQPEERGSERRRDHESEPGLQPRVWIGSLADYNNGTLTGEWIDAAVADEDLAKAARAVVARSETPDAEEWAIFDYDDFGSWKPGEYEDITLVATVARGIAEHGPAFAAWAELHDADPDMLAAFQDSYLGEYDSPSTWAREVLGESEVEQRIEEAVGKELGRHVEVDYDGFARDCWLGGDIYLVHSDDGRVWIFDTNP